jgi:hypothetical protein
MSAQFTDGGGVLDDAGTAAPRDWYAQFITDSAELGATEHHVTIGAPVHNAVTRNTAYVVVPAVLSFYMDGALRTTAGPHFTVSLRRRDGVWRIDVWTWSLGRARFW